MAIDDLPIIETRVNEQEFDDIPVVERAKFTMPNGKPVTAYVGGIFQEDEGRYDCWDQLIVSFNTYELDGEQFLQRPRFYIPKDDAKNYKVVSLQR